MALEVEDGTGKSNAESYVSVADADAYHTSFGTSAWAAATPTDREVALRKATRYLDTRYTFRGQPLLSTQALSWPRTGYASNEVPDETWPVRRLKNSCCELALVALTSELYVNEDSRALKAETIGPLKFEYTDPRFGGQTRYTMVDDMLSPLVSGGSGSRNVRVVRAS